MRRVLVLNNIPAPYFDPLFARLGDERDWSLRVCYTSVWNENAGWLQKPIAQTNYRNIVLDRMHMTLGRLVGSSFAAALALFDEMVRERPDYSIIYGYTLLPQSFAIVWSALTGVPFAIIGDANVHTDRAKGIRRVIKTAWLRFVVSQASALIAIGTANRLFWEHYGARKEQLFEAHYAVDNEHFAREIAAARTDREMLRSKLRLTARIVFLFVGRLVKRKNVDLIIRALRQVDAADIALVVVGDGEERAVLEALAADDQRVIFAGAVQQSDLPRYYALADVLILPASDEPWGLVINEAMAGGLAVIAHCHCGAAVDLVGPDNGVALQSFEVEELAQAMRTIASNDEMRDRMKIASSDKVQAWSIDGAARGIIDAVTRSSGDGLHREGATRVGEVE